VLFFRKEVIIMAVAKGNIRLPVTIPKSLRDQLEKLANDDNRTIGNYIKNLLIKHVEEKTGVRFNEQKE
jgi:predicted DNA-binding protein